MAISRLNNPHTTHEEPQYCGSCHRPLGTRYYVVLDRRERFCPDCIASRPRCDNCGVPLGNDAWQLHDGRLQCGYCHRTAVYDTAQAHALYNETVSKLVAQFDLKLRVGVDFQLIDRPTMQQLRQGDPAYNPRIEKRTLGLYQMQGRQRAIYLLHGLPRLLFRTTVAHEYAHAWQAEHCPMLDDTLLREGFAEWVAYHHLKYIQSTLAAERMLNSNHPYRPALEHVLNLEQRLGQRGVLDYVRHAQ